MERSRPKRHESRGGVGGGWESVDEFQAGGILLSGGGPMLPRLKKKKKEAACKIIYSDRNVASAGLSKSVL